MNKIIKTNSGGKKTVIDIDEQGGESKPRKTTKDEEASFDHNQIDPIEFQTKKLEIIARAYESLISLGVDHEVADYLSNGAVNV